MKHKLGTFLGAFLAVLFFTFQVFTQVNQTPIYLSYEQRVALSYILSAVHKSPEEQKVIAAQMRKMLFDLKDKEIQKIKVSSFDEFLKVFRGDWPNSHSLDLDLEYIRQRNDLRLRTYEASTPDLQDRIDQYINEQTRYMKNEFTKKGVPLPTVEQVMGLAAASVVDGGQMLTEEMLKAGASLVKSEMKVIDQVGEELVASGELKGMNGGMRRMMELAIGHYFKHLSLSSKVQIMNIGFGERIDSSNLEKFEVLVAGAGPQFQKLLQIMAREQGLSPDLLSVFKKLEDSVRPVPRFLWEAILAGETKNYDIVSMDEKPIGIGSMAQVHKGKMKLENGEVIDVVIRFLKPDIEKRVEEDRRILAELAPFIDKDQLLKAERFPPLTPMVDNLTQTVVDELSLLETINRQVLAQIRYKFMSDIVFSANGKIFHVGVPDVYFPKTNQAKVMVQGLVSGKKLDDMAEKYKKEIPDLKIKIVEEIAKLWIREVLFGQGFFHADLHQGNFMVNVKDTQVNLNLLDFGMAGTLLPETRQALLSLAAGLESLKANTIAEAFWAISDKQKNITTYEQFYLEVDGLTRDMKNGILQTRSFDAWVSFAIQSGIRLPHTFVNLNRGFVILNKLLKEVGSNYEMSVLAKREGRSKPLQVLKAFWNTESITLMDIARIAYYYVMNKVPVKADNLIVQAYSYDGIKARGGLKCELLFAK